MKQNDIAVIIVVIAVSAIGSFFISNKIFNSAAQRSQEVEKVDAISAEFQLPSKKYFNEDSIDPTLPIEVGDNNNTNTNPFIGD